MCKELKYPSMMTIKKLTKDLHLKSVNEYTQDWECEVACFEQLEDYIYYYQNTELNINEKATLMRIILEAYNELLSLNPLKHDYWNIISQLIQQDYSVHEEIIRYWACEEDLENCFAITPFIRTAFLQGN